MKGLDKIWKKVSAIAGSIILVVTAAYGFWTWIDDVLFTELEAGELTQAQRHMDYKLLATATEHEIEILKIKIKILSAEETLTREQEIQLEIWQVELAERRMMRDYYEDAQDKVHIPAKAADPNDPE